MTLLNYATEMTDSIKSNCYTQDQAEAQLETIAKYFNIVYNAQIKVNINTSNDNNIKEKIVVKIDKKKQAALVQIFTNTYNKVTSQQLTKSIKFTIETLRKHFN